MACPKARRSGKEKLNFAWVLAEKVYKAVYEGHNGIDFGFLRKDFVEAVKQFKPYEFYRAKCELAKLEGEKKPVKPLSIEVPKNLHIKVQKKIC